MDLCYHSIKRDAARKNTEKFRTATGVQRIIAHGKDNEVI